MKTITLNKLPLDLSTPVVMGILNVTPDSFYDGGKYTTETAVIRRINQIVEEGAGIIDVGAYSTRPGAAFVDEQEELGRLSWAVELVRKYYPNLPVSIDTFRAGVAREIVSCLGEVIVNDISGGTLDENMFDFVAETGVPYIMMHIQGTPQTMQQNPVYEDVVREVRQFLTERIAVLNAKGFDNIILDPGFGFGKTLVHNYELMSGMDTYQDLGYPLLVGISRKTMIYKLLGGTAQDALNGTTVLNTIALLKGANILRVHDVKEAVETVRIVQQLNR
ncbi:MAG TPA: dihydropteroate synthase [Candidatus Odoribacter faecigallinarum]|uniref:Dihydropteroate synthase n=1 Tax=Candidatus Odoribacter faecigallinarum TaxID=2838706 RepID=A0A9D1V1E9_9BACT|nr:dihydropteroate synthase [Candidatus Odoribacter faecigallinarum]